MFLNKVYQGKHTNSKIEYKKNGEKKAVNFTLTFIRNNII